jgi:hypothetical protein
MGGWIVEILAVKFTVQLFWLSGVKCRRFKINSNDGCGEASVQLRQAIESGGAQRSTGSGDTVHTVVPCSRQLYLGARITFRKLRGRSEHA